ncbi:hypothetical protein BCR32DRAFT_290481 [Anaeromyces robustus]|uniref:Uncharacterized protein n=1 Tax=Anaeromyces robustus TaxID=1754192 RepID=A0A1Y1XIV6_9FUNG|nr:hypothetical protein BCR32DRAFT_290481 [Anaeromyces robustus]|eukprot:ORX85697.1 hypothetical protein BCR32DRAFT_290481 [Anaeromyces robustus]
MNKENILSKKLNSSSHWKSPKVNKKQIEKWKEQTSSEKRGLHIKSLSDNNIIDSSSPFDKSDSSHSFFKDDNSNSQEQFIQQLIKKIEFYEGYLTKSQLQEGEKYLKQSTYKNYNRTKSVYDSEQGTPISLREYTNLKKENKSLQERLNAALKTNDELMDSLNNAEALNSKLKEDFLVVKKEKDELVDDISNLNDVVNLLVERENWIPPEELEEKIEEALLAAQVKDPIIEDNVHNESLKNNSKMDTSNDSLNTLISTSSSQSNKVKITTSTVTEYEEMINDLKKQIENLTIALNEKNEALEKKETETKELYDEIKEYHEVFDSLKEREDWVSPEEVEEIRGELYDAIVQKGFIETELQEKKELIEQLKKSLLS